MGQGFVDGVEPGGIYQSTDIKLLVCYMLLNVREPLPRQSVLDIVAGGGMANFFETETAIDELVDLKNIQEDAEGLLQLTEQGRTAAQDLAGRLPYTLRQRSVQAALALLARSRREKENSFSVKQNQHGCAVTCRIHQGSSDLLSLTLQVADEQQANWIGENFINDPVALYQSVLELLAGLEPKKEHT